LSNSEVDDLTLLEMSMLSFAIFRVRTEFLSISDEVESPQVAVFGLGSLYLGRFADGEE